MKTKGYDPHNVTFCLHALAFVFFMDFNFFQQMHRLNVSTLASCSCSTPLCISFFCPTFLFFSSQKLKTAQDVATMG